MKSDNKMDFNDISTYLDNLPVFTPKGVDDGSIKYNLKSIDELLKRVGRPDKKIKIIHIAGTNGKGSTGIFLRNILSASGYKTGSFTSPELIRFDEQIRVDGKVIGENNSARIISKLKGVAEQMMHENLQYPSKFELLFAAAMVYFEEQKCDYAVLECGLGGTNDATNVIDVPYLAVITDIDIDHTSILGNTKEEIAHHKAGIIKKGGTVLAIEGALEVNKVLSERAKEVGAKIEFTSSEDIIQENSIITNLDGQRFKARGIDGEIRMSMLGTYQIRNAALAIRASQILKEKGTEGIDVNSIIEGILRAKNPCRFEVVKKKPYIIIDGAHNTGGVRELVKSISKFFPGEKIIFIAGILEDKEYAKMLKVISPYAEIIYTVKPESIRALGAEELANVAKNLGIKALACSTYEDAIETALKEANGRPICVFGSLYFVGRIRELVIRMKG